MKNITPVNNYWLIQAYFLRFLRVEISSEKWGVVIKNRLLRKQNRVAITLTK